MATRSLIGIEHEDGSISSIYCHWDGYPEGVGATLVKHYLKQEQVEALVKAGDRSSLGADPSAGAYEPKECGVKLPNGGWPRMSQEWVYLFRNGEWLYKEWNEHFDYRPLMSAMEQLGARLEDENDGL